MLRRMRRTVLTTLLTLAVAVAYVVVTGAAPSSAAEPYRLADQARSAGLYDGVDRPTWAATAVDYNGDGLQDVWVGYHQFGGKLYRNNGDGTFTWVARDAWQRADANGAIVDRHDCTFGDVNGDGRPDAYCTAGRNTSNYVKDRDRDNQLWVQRNPGRFVEVGTDRGLGDQCGRGRHAAFLDVNNDGRLDLFTGTQSGRNVADPCDDPANGLTNEDSKVFVNQGGGQLRYAPSYGVGVANSGQRCAEVLDFDGDGRDDLLACNLKDSKPQLYRNAGGGKFVDVADANGLTPISDAVVADINQDGRPDLVTADDQGFGYRLNTGGAFGPLIRVGAATGGLGRSVAVADADGDGDLDIYGMIGAKGATGNPDDALFVNDGAQGWRRVAVPSAGGTADEVVALSSGPGRRGSFLVLNGRQQDGPVQLIKYTGPKP